MKYFIAFLLLSISINSYSQKDTLNVTIQGTVIDNQTRLPMASVHIINTTKVKGTISDSGGLFEIVAQVNDTLLISFLSYETLKIKVTNDWIKNKTAKVVLTEQALALEEVEIKKKYNLTGYIEVDTKIIPVRSDDYRYSISGLPSSYEAGDRSPGAVGKILKSIFNPADFLYNVFGKRPRQMKKLQEMKKDDTVRNLLSTKFDRVTLAALLEVSKEDIPLILENCNYSKYFIETANDLQILEAISSCYEEYKVLKKDR